MNDIRRSILWVVFGFSMVLIWDKWQIHNGKAPTFFPSSAVTAPKPADTAPPAAGVGSSLPAALPGAAAPGTPPQGAGSAAQVRHTITTDVLRLTFNSEGGSLVGAQLLKHAQDAGGRKNLEQPPFTLLENDAERVYMAQGIAQDHDLLLLDEPLTGLDLVSARTIDRIIHAERDNRQTVVLTTHDLDEARAADHVLLVSGRVVASGTPDEVLTRKNLELAYGLGALHETTSGFLDDPHRSKHHHRHGESTPEH